MSGQQPGPGTQRPGFVVALNLTTTALFLVAGILMLTVADRDGAATTAGVGFLAAAAVAALSAHLTRRKMRATPRERGPVR